MVRDQLIAKLLRIRLKKGGTRLLRLSRAQQEYSQRCGKQNIVLKARQVEESRRTLPGRDSRTNNYTAGDADWYRWHTARNRRR